MVQNSDYKQSIMLKFENFLDTHEQYLDSFIDTGTEQELFIASYIHGHFSVVAARILSILQNTNEQNLSSIKFNDLSKNFESELRKSVYQAIDEGELKSTDSIQVNDLLDNLFS